MSGVCVDTALIAVFGSVSAAQISGQLTFFRPFVTPIPCRPKVRYNEGYRAPLDYLSPNDIDQFYEHHQSLIAIMRCERTLC